MRAGVAEHKAECESRIAQVDAEIRAACRPPKLREQEQRARLADNVSACAELIALIDEDGPI